MGSYPETHRYCHAYCRPCNLMLECVQHKGRKVKGIECPECKRHVPIVSRGVAPLKGFVIGLALFLEDKT